LKRYEVYVLPSVYDPDHDWHNLSFGETIPKSAQFWVSAFTALPSVDDKTAGVLYELSRVSDKFERDQSARRERNANHPLVDKVGELIDRFIDDLSKNIPAGSGIKLLDPSIRGFDLTSHGLHAVSCVDPEADVQKSRVFELGDPESDTFEPLD
jgi:hypothetical protein